jgi:hypothetical protein
MIQERLRGIVLAHAMGLRSLMRATVSHEHLALAMVAIARDVDYSNFKSAVARQQDGRREAVYRKVWAALWQLERIELDRA